MLIGVFALVFGISAAAGVYLLMSNAHPVAKLETVSVVVAAVDINRGQSLTAAELTKRDWPKDLVPEGAVTNLEEVLDRTIAIPLNKGDLLLDGKLAGKGAGHGMAAIIPPGMRAVTIQTPNVATGVAGFILPGNKVDILLTMNNTGVDDRTGGGSTITLLQMVEILAVDQRTDAPQDNKIDSKELRSVTLLVTPAQAARLDLGQNKGTLRLTLRNPIDKATEFVDPATLAGLSLNPNDIVPEPIESSPPVVVQMTAPAVIPPKKFPAQIRTLRGTRSGQILFPDLNDDPVDPTVVPVAAPKPNPSPVT